VMRTAIVFASALVVAAAATGGAATPELKTDDQKTLYAIGLALSRNLGSFSLTEPELELVKAGLSDGVLKRKAQVDLQTYGPKIQDMQKSRAGAVASVERKSE